MIPNNRNRLPGDLGRVVVVGAGVVGCFLAYRLAREGVPVTIIERKGIAAEGSGASAGNVQPATGTYDLSLITLDVESLALFRRYLPEIRETSGIDFKDQEVRYLYAAMEEDGVQELKSFSSQLVESGLVVEWIDGVEATSMEPRLSTDLRGGMLHQDCIQMDPGLFVRALGKSAEAHEAAITFGEVVGIARQGSRISAVRLADGSTIACDTVVLAAGAWSGLALERWLGISMPIGPLPQQKLHLSLDGPPLGCAIRWLGANIVQRVDGLIHLGSKPDDTGFNAATTSEGKEWLLERIWTMLPSLQFQVSESVAGCAASTPDKIPIIGRMGDLDGLYIAVPGNNGFLLSAVIADILTNLMVRGEHHHMLGEMSPHAAIKREWDYELD